MSARIAGRGLFARLEEASSVRTIDPTSAEQNKAALARAIDTIRSVFEGHISAAPDCKNSAFQRSE